MSIPTIIVIGAAILGAAGLALFAWERACEVQLMADDDDHD